ncbi:MAG: hypothetical protein ACI96M_000427 [Candidatus Azotimanducaceae bacterium]|jgi:hypothetical protein
MFRLLLNLDGILVLPFGYLFELILHVYPFTRCDL